MSTLETPDSLVWQHSEHDADMLALNLAKTLGLPSDHLIGLRIEFNGPLPWAVVTCKFNYYGDAAKNKEVQDQVSKYRLVKIEDGTVTAKPDAEKHPAEIALALLRDFPEIDEARMAAEGSNRPQQFRKYARPIIDAYFAPLGEKLCRPPCPPPTAE